jgi:TrmH family RNA methyltransferase
LEIITSRQNQHFRKLMDLHDRKEREATNQYIVEGEKELSLVKAIDVLYFDVETPFVVELKKKSKQIIRASKDLIAKASYRGGNEIAICSQNLCELEDLKNKKFLVAIESLEKPGNLGAILRTADGAGVDGVIVIDSVTDVFNPNVVRASLGALFSLDVVETSSEKAIDFLIKNDIQIIVTSPSAEKKYYEVDFRKPSCIVVGSESKGLKDEWFNSEKCIAVKIPMLGEVDSLNASTSASIVIYEALRQRYSLSR